MNFNGKRIRLLWKEFLSSGNTLYPSISFDNGLSWINLDKDTDLLRNGDSKNITINKSAINSDSGLTEMDMSFGFTPYCRPQIVDIKYSKSSDTTNFIMNKTYYFAVTSTNFDSTGRYRVEDNLTQELYGLTFEEKIQEIRNDTSLSDEQKTAKINELKNEVVSNHIFYDGPINETDDSTETISYNYKKKLGLDNYSDIVSVTLDTIDDSQYYIIDLYINYAYFAQGINVYCGESKDDLKLVYISNLTNILEKDLGSSTAVDNTIYLKNIFPMPYKGVIKIDSEYIPYSKCVYESSEERNGCWKLTVDNGSRTPYLGLTNHNADTPVYLVTNDEYKLRKPAKIYDYSSLDSGIKYYLNFNSENSFEVVRKDNVATIGNPSYGAFDANYGISYYVDGKSLIEMDYTDDTLNEEGSILFNFVLTDFLKDNEENPYIISPKGDNGIYVKINRNNSKLEIGYKYSSEKSVVIFSSEDYRIPVFSSSKFNCVGISWIVDTDNTIKFRLNIDNATDIEMPTLIKKDDFSFKELYIGGGYNSNDVIISPIGYIDNVILFNKAFANMSITFRELTRKYKKEISTLVGKLTLGYLFNKDDMNSIETYNDKGTNNSNCLYDYTSYKKNATEEDIGNNHYEPKIHTAINSTTAILDSSATPTIKGYFNGYDRWLVYEYIKQDADWYNVFPCISYPIIPETVQVKYKMGYTTDYTFKGFTTPFIYNPSVIVSNMSIG